MQQYMHQQQQHSQAIKAEKYTNQQHIQNQAHAQQQFAQGSQPGGMGMQPGGASGQYRMGGATMHGKLSQQRGANSGNAGGAMGGPQNASGKPLGGNSGALGRKGSMPENLMNPLNHVLHTQHNPGSASYLHQQQQQQHASQQRGNSYGTKQMQRSKDARIIQYGNDSLQQMNQGTNVAGKLIKSHAKYFSQQNSPVHRQSMVGGKGQPTSSGQGYGGYSNAQVSKHHQKHTGYPHQQSQGPKQGTQTGMGTISGAGRHELSQQQFLQAQQLEAPLQAALQDGSTLQNTIDADNLNTFGVASTVAQNMENDYLMTMECNQYRQSLDQRRHPHQTMNRQQQQQYRHPIYNEGQPLVHAAMNSQQQAAMHGYGHSSATGVNQQTKSSQKQKQAQKQQAPSSHEYSQYRVQMPDGQYRSIIQHSIATDPAASQQNIDQQYTSLPQQPQQDYMKKYHSQNQSPMLQNTAQNQTVAPSTNNSFVSQSVSHGGVGAGAAQNQSSRIKSVKQKYDESFLNHSLNNASNPALLVESSGLQGVTDSIAQQINQTIGGSKGGQQVALANIAGGGKRHSHNHSAVLQQSHHHQMPTRVSYDPRQRQMVVAKAKQRSVNTQMSVNYDKHKQQFVNNGEPIKTVKKSSQKSTDLSGYRYKNSSSQMGPIAPMQPQSQLQSSSHHQQQQQRASSGSGLNASLHKPNSKRVSKAQTRPVSNKKQQMMTQMTQQSNSAFGDQILQQQHVAGSGLSSNNQIHQAPGNTLHSHHLAESNTIIRNKYAVSQSAHSEMQHGSFQLAHVSGGALREKKKSIESSTHSQSLIQYRKTAMPITTVPSQKKLQNNQSLNMNHSGSVLVPQSYKGSVVGSTMSGMPSTVVRAKAGQAQTTKTSPQRKQLGTPLDTNISISVLHSNSTNQKLSEYKKGYQPNSFGGAQQQMAQHNVNQSAMSHLHPHLQGGSNQQHSYPQGSITVPSQQSINQEQPSITVMPSQLNISSLKQIKQLVRGKNSSELNFYQKRLSQHQMNASKQRTASQNSSGSYQKEPQVSASSHSRHSQNTLHTSHSHNRPQVAQHQGNLMQERHAYVEELKQPVLKSHGISMPRVSHVDVEQYQDPKQPHQSYKVGKPVDVARHGHSLSSSGNPQLRQHPEKKAGQMLAVNASLGQIAVSESGKGVTERPSADYQHRKQLNLNDSANIHVEDSLREAVGPQHSKSSLSNSVNYGMGRPSGSSKSQLGRGQRVATAGKPQSSKLTEGAKSGQSQKNLRKYSAEGDGSSSKGAYAYQSHPAKSQASSSGPNTKRMHQHSSSLSMSQMMVQKGINNRQTSHSSTGFHQKNSGNTAMPQGFQNVDNGSNVFQSSAQFGQHVAANGLMLKAAHISIKGANTTSANTAVNTTKNSPRIVHQKSKSIQSGGANKSHSSVGPSQNNYMQAKGGQASERQLRDGNHKSVASGHGSKQYLAGAGPQTVKPKSSHKQKNFGTLAHSNHAYPSALAKGGQPFDGAHIQPANLNTISNYQQSENLAKPISSQYKHGNGSSSQKSLNKGALSGQQSSGPHYMQLSNMQMSNQSPPDRGVHAPHGAYPNAPASIDPNNRQPHQWYLSSAVTAESAKKKALQQVMDGGTGSVAKLENSQDQIDSFQHSSKQQKSKKIERKTQNILKNAQKTASILSSNDQMLGQYVVSGHEADLAHLHMPDGPLITEEDEAEIRQVASDINEKAFFGKILRTKSIIEKHHQQSELFDQQIQKLSPRSQEIAFVMKKISDSFKTKKEAPETTLDFYRIGKMLGRGAFGKVNLAMHKLVRKLVALKSLNKECLTDEVQKQKLMKEVNLLLKLRHDNVVKIYETIETKKHIIIVMELCAGGDLLNYVRKRRRLKEPVAKKIFKQIIDGLRYIHSKYVAHRDIKLDNILLDGKGQVKIADFGVSKQSTPGVKMRDQCGTPAYIAPEILRNKNGYSFGVDLWSAGVVLYAMLYGTVPFKAASMEELHSLILRGIYTLKDDISQEARDMLRGLLEINPHKRFNYEQIISHPWLADLDPSLQLFNQHERELIKKEYTYNDPSRYNRNENEEPVDCFTEHNIDSVYNTMKNCSEKSIILAPFNSTQSEDIEVFKKRIKPMIMEKAVVLRLSRLCREIDRQYEFNNNGQLDNGVYHKQLNNSAEDAKKGGDKKKKDKKDKKEESSEDDELKFQVMQCSRSQGRDFLTEDFEDEADFKKQKKEFLSNMLANMTDAEKKLIESTFGTNHDLEVDEVKINHMVQYGYPRSYITKCLQENLPNYTTAGYYLLLMDQTYTS